MKRKVGTLIEEDVIKLARRQAAEEDRPLIDLIENALVDYLNRKCPDLKKMEEAYKIFCEQPIQITRDQFVEILKEDVLGL
jgi:phage FluMu protein Com